MLTVLLRKTKNTADGICIDLLSVKVFGFGSDMKQNNSKLHFQPFLQPFCSHCIKGIVFRENN